MIRTTETESHHQDLEHMSTRKLLLSINQEDRSVPDAVERAIPAIEKLVDVVAERMKVGGRMFYIGAGTSGRLGILDASECPPTFGVPHDWIMGLIAGGDTAIRRAVENAEDDAVQAWEDLKTYQINDKDTVVGIAASGTTPYVIGGLKQANAAGLVTGCIVCNADSPIAAEAQHPIEVVVGPEFVTGSTRMKAGTAQKLVLNMLSTSVMIKLGRVKGNKMVDMQLSNQKLVERGVQMVMDQTGASTADAKAYLGRYGSVRAAVEQYEAASKQS